MSIMTSGENLDVRVITKEQEQLLRELRGQEEPSADTLSTKRHLPSTLQDQRCSNTRGLV